MEEMLAGPSITMTTQRGRLRVLPKLRVFPAMTALEKIEGFLRQNSAQAYCDDH
jgi:hypothetical protein